MRSDPVRTAKPGTDPARPRDSAWALQPAQLTFAFEPARAERILRHATTRAWRATVSRRRSVLERFFDTADFALARSGYTLCVEARARTHWQQLEELSAQAHLLAGHYVARAALRSGEPEARLLAIEPLDRDTGTSARGRDPVLTLVFERRGKRTELELCPSPSSRILLRLTVGELATGQHQERFAELTLVALAGPAGELCRTAQAYMDSVPLRLLAADSRAQGLALAGLAPVALQRDPVGRDQSRQRNRKGTFSDALDGLVALGREALVELIEHAERTRGGTDPEDIHRARVLLRRLLLVLTWIGRLQSPDAVAASRRDVRALYRSMGPARDWTVFADLLGQAGPAAPDGEREVRLEAARSHRDEACQLARQRLHTPQFQRLAVQIAGDLVLCDAPHKAHTPFRFGRRLGERLARADVRLHHGTKGWAAETPEAQHRIRQRARAMRDEAQLLARFGLDRWLGDHVDELARLQAALGALNDWSSARGLAAALGQGQEPDLLAWIETGRQQALVEARRSVRRFRRLAPLHFSPQVLRRVRHSSA